VETDAVTASVYLARCIAAHLAWATVGCLVLYLGIDLVEVRGRTFAEIPRVLPRALHDVAIGSAAIGGAIALSRLRRAGEWHAMRALGIGRWTLIGAALPSVVGLVVTVATLSHFVLPWNGARSDDNTEVLESREWAWAWEGGLLVATIDRVNPGQLDDVRIWFDVRQGAVDGSWVFAEAGAVWPCQGQWCAEDGWSARWVGGELTRTPFERLELPLLASEVGRDVRPVSSLTTSELLRENPRSNPRHSEARVRVAILRIVYTLLCGLVLLLAVIVGSVGDRRRGILGPVFVSMGIAAVIWLSASWGISAGWY